jgi:hypothetical protein
MKPRASNQKNRALMLVEVLVVIVVLVVLAFLFLYRPFLHRRPVNRHNPAPYYRINCVNNLKQIGLAYRIWAGDHNNKYPMEASATNGGTMELVDDGENASLNYLVMSNELNTPKILWCAADKDHTRATNFTTDFNNSKISYFVGLDADQTDPQAFLSGDDNFEIDGVPAKSGLLELSRSSPISWTAARHKFVGNIGLADGSVWQTDEKSLVQKFQATGLTTNRLAIP